MKTSVIYEMNHTYMHIEGDELEQIEDYRHEMLANNEIDGLIMPRIIRIDAGKIIQYDITDRENLLNYLAQKTADRKEIEHILRSVWKISKKLKDYLIDESNIILNPELIYRNVRTGEYEFICTPIKEYELEAIDGEKSLLQLLMTKMDVNDDLLVETVVNIYNAVETSKTAYTSMYEFFIESIQTDRINSISEVEIEEPEEERVKLGHINLPIKTVGTIGLCIAGILIIGIHIILVLP